MPAATFDITGNRPEEGQKPPPAPPVPLKLALALALALRHWHCGKIEVQRPQGCPGFLTCECFGLEAPGGPRRSQEAPGSFRRPQAAPGNAGDFSGPTGGHTNPKGVTPIIANKRGMASRTFVFR